MKKQQGFSLPEMAVILTLVSVLSSIALPKIMQGSVKAKMIEVKLQSAHMFRLADFHYNIWGEIPETAQDMGYETPASALFNYSQLLDDNVDESAGGKGKGNSKQKVMEHKTTICHKNFVEITVANPSVANAHLDHGDTIGECDVADENTLVFTIIPKNAISAGCDSTAEIRSYWTPDFGGDIIDFEGACTTYFPGTGG